jgi:RNA 3'-terminal phosphate cyclase (ATP)
MIEIDGSIGGGQLLRTAIGLSSILGKPVRITNIRKGKGINKPGLKPQHMIGVKVAGEFCNARISGLYENSLEVEFIPGKIALHDKKIDIGTAGSISLVLQTITPMLMFGNKPVTLDIIGGTEVSWSPTIQYIKYVTFPLLNKLGAKLEMEIVKHGYYPKGGGEVIVKSRPVKNINPFICLERGNIMGIVVDSVCGQLPSHVAERQGNSALSTMKYHFPDVKTSMSYKSVNSLSLGSSVTCYAVCENSILGGSCLGEPGLKAEKVGETAAEELIKSLKSNAALDRYMADQILLYVALAKGRSHLKVEEITDHCKTNMGVMEQIIPVEFKTENNEIIVDGLGKT